MPIATMKESLVHELADLYDAEHRFLEGQQQMLAKASDPKLNKLLAKHIEETQVHIANLEDGFKTIGEAPKRQECDGSKGLVSEAQKMIEEAAVPEIRDLFISSSAAKAEAYEINSYEGLIAEAEALGLTKLVTVLNKNLRQENRMFEALEKAEPALVTKTARATGEAPAGAGRK
jgi:ferritin-like metal-binding protein YciE